MSVHEDHEIVSFNRPPVEEVALAAQFVDSILDFDHLCELNRRLAKDFPVKQVQPALPRMALGDGPALSVRLPGSLPRLWFVAGDGHRLVQAQEDRIALNWRRLGKPVPYPRYSPLREEFQEHLAITAEAIGFEPGVDVVELTYVNELTEPRAPEHRPSPLGGLLVTVAASTRGEFLPEPADQQWAARWEIPPGEGGLRGRLEARAEPAISRVSGHFVYLLTLTCRMAGEAPLASSGLLNALDIAHEWVVRGFADLTPSNLHQHWGRTR